MKIGLKLSGEIQDATTNDQVKQLVSWGSALEGDQVGPFDHPEGVPADSPFQVEHELGEVPGSFAIEDPGYTGRGVYANADDREAWTDATVMLRSPDTTNKNIVIRVRRRFDA